MTKSGRGREIWIEVENIGEERKGRGFRRPVIESNSP